MTLSSWSLRRIYKTKIYSVIRSPFGHKESEIGWFELINKTIIDPFMRQCSFRKNYMVFDISEYRSYPLCFWKTVLTKIFNIYTQNGPSTKDVTAFIQFVNTKAFGTHSFSNNTHCTIKLDIMTITFQY